MKFTINKNIIVEALSNAVRALSTKITIPVLNGILLNLTNDGLEVQASDSELTIKTTIEAKNIVNIEKEGRAVLQSRCLLEIIRKMPSEIINFELTENNNIKIYSDINEYIIECYNIGEYPNIALEKSQNTIYLESKILKEMINQTSYAMSMQEVRPLLTGLNLKINGNILECTATDSYRLAQKVIYLDESNNFNVTIPAKNLLDISKIMPSDGKVDIYVDDKKALFVFDNVLVQTRLIEGNYPQTSRLIPTSFISELTVDARDFLSALERASFIKNEGVNIVRLQLTEDNILLTCKSNEIISQEVIVPTSFTGEAIDISFKGNYVYDAIRALNTYEVKINLCGSMKPFTLVSTNSDQLLQLVLPIKTYN